MKINVPAALERRLSSLAADGKLAEAGRRLVQEGVVSVQGFPDARIRLFDDWSANPFDSRSWQWAIAAFRFVPGLIAYHASTGDEHALDFAAEAIASWQQAVAGPLRDYEFARHDHATASQAESLVHLLAYLRTRNLREQDWPLLVETLRRHADLLTSDNFYSRHTNHGIEQSRILAMVADLFPEESRSSGWMSLALDRLIEELAFAFGDEGVHVENSPAYHCYVCLSFLKILGYFPRQSIEALATKVDSVMPKAIRFLTHVVRPDGCLPTIGDTFAVKAPNHFKRYARTQAYRELRYALSNGAEGDAPAETSRLFPKSGYFIARDRWQATGDGRDAFHLVFRCGFRSMYHRHDDDLSLVLYCGEDWLLDSGPYNYSEHHPLRRYLRSKWAHNVPVVLEPRSRRWKLERPRMPTAMTRLPAPDGQIAVRGVSHSYPAHVSMRDVYVDVAAREFVVTDAVVQSEALGRKRYLSLWHVPIDKDVDIDGQTVVLTSKMSGRQLRIENIGRRATQVSLVDPGVEGFDGPAMSRTMNESEPCRLLAFEWAGIGMQSSLRFRMIDGPRRSGGDSGPRPGH